MENKLKYLELVQSVINRMANNSFYVKGWAITLVSALIALSSRDANGKYIVISWLPIILFWGLDAYYLRQEKLFRKLYDFVRIRKDNKIDFSMDTKRFSKKVPCWFCMLFSKTIISFYGISVLTIAIISWVIFK